MTADDFVARLMEHRSEEELRKVQRYFKSGDDFIGVRMGQVFALAKEFVELAPDEIEKLLESPIHEARAGALSIMGKQATRRRTTAERRRELYGLARSTNMWERRIAMYATLALVRAGDVDDTFALAEILVDDDEDLIQKVVGGLLREAGKHDRPRLLAFLDRHAATMPRTALRYSIEHLEKEQKAHYMSLKRPA
jgi:HEAT repeat protein